MPINMSDAIRDFEAFWLTHFPESDSMDREEAMASINDATDGMGSRRADGEMIPYQNRVAAVYGAYAPLAYQLFTLVRLLEHVTFSPGDHIVSLGSGPAAFELWLLQAGFVQRATLVDQSPIMLERTRQIARAVGAEGKVTFLARDVIPNRLPVNSADVVISTAAMHWTNRWREWVTAACQVSRRGGQIFLSASMHFPRSMILPDELTKLMKAYCIMVRGGLIVPPTMTAAGLAMSSRIFVAAQKKGR